MSVHFSLGLVPDEPRCRYHGRTMKLCDAAVPIFFVSNANTRNLRHTGRKIYRCKVKGCPVVANGPTEIWHSKHEISMEQIRV